MKTLQKLEGLTNAPSTVTLRHSLTVYFTGCHYTTIYGVSRVYNAHESAMTTALVLEPNIFLGHDVSELLSARGLRVVNSDSVADLRAKLGIFVFDAVFVGQPLSWQEHVELAQAFWEGSPKGTYFVYSPDDRSRPNVARLKERGISVALGDQVGALLVDEAEKLMPLSPSGLSPRVLLVGSLKTPQEILRGVLHKLGYLGKATNSGEVALQMVQKSNNTYFLIITEASTSDISALEMIQRVRADSKIATLPVVVLTAYATSNVLWDSLMAGVSGFIVKPPERELVIKELGRARRIWSGLEPTRLAPSDPDALKRFIVERLKATSKSAE